MKVLLAVLTLALLSGCAREPESRKIADVASQHGAVLDDLLRLTSNRDRVLIVTKDMVRRLDGTVFQVGSLEAGQFVEDWRKIAEFVDTIDAEQVILRPNPREVEIIFYAYGLVSGGYAKGLVWKSHRPECVENIDELIGKTGTGRFYSATPKNDWYVFLRVDG